METTTPRGVALEQKRMYYQMLLTWTVAMIVSQALHKPMLLFSITAMGWMVSIIFAGKVGYWGITRGVLAMGVMAYLIYRFVFPNAL